jgi:hypothetical protein
LVASICVGAQRLDKACLGSRQQLRKHAQVIAAGGGELECCIHVNPNHVPALREPQLSLAGKQHFPGFMFLLTDQGVLAVGAALSIGSGPASGAGQVVVTAGPAVLGPSARLEVPAAKDPYNDMDASR